MGRAVRVVCVKWGDKYPDDYVTRLRAMFARHLSLPHEFECVTDDPVPGVVCRKPVCDYPYWWQKIGLFAPGFLVGPTVYCDLDMVLVRSVDWAANYTACALAAIENWGSRTHEGPLYEDEISSAFMVWKGSNPVTDEIFLRFTMADAARLSPHGDQTFVTEVMRGKVAHIAQERICSYKRHCRGKDGPPPEASVVAFHGTPRPHEVEDEWLRSAWR